MPRQNYMTIAASNTIQAMFNEFVQIKGLTKTEAMNDMLELYMLASDEKVYLELKKKYLRVDSVKEAIIQKEFGREKEDHIFIKLTQSSDYNGITRNGTQTLQVYLADVKKYGFSWFFTQAHYFGMSDKKVAYYKKRIAEGKIVKLLFILGESAGGENDIAYSATIMDIVSHKEPVPPPDHRVPDAFYGQRARLWVKIKDLKQEKELKASMFKVQSTGKDLQDIVRRSQCFFGYISFK